MENKMHIHNLFPVPVMRVEQFIDEQQIENMLPALRRFQTQENAKSALLAHSEVIEPTQDPAFHGIMESMSPYLRDFGFLLFGENLQWHIKEMWVNFLHHGGHQSIHSHANSFISAVVFLTETDDSTKTVFHNTMGTKQYVFSNAHQESATTPYNSDRWVATDIQKGDLILFPSYLLHAVPNNLGKERISIACNALPERLKSWDYEVRFGQASTETVQQ